MCLHAAPNCSPAIARRRQAIAHNFDKSVRPLIFDIMTARGYERKTPRVVTYYKGAMLTGSWADFYVRRQQLACWTTYGDRGEGCVAGIIVATCRHSSKQHCRTLGDCQALCEVTASCNFLTFFDDVGSHGPHCRLLEHCDDLHTTWAQPSRTYTKTSCAETTAPLRLDYAYVGCYRHLSQQVMEWRTSETDISDSDGRTGANGGATGATQSESRSDREVNGSSAGAIGTTWSQCQHFTATRCAPWFVLWAAAAGGGGGIASCGVGGVDTAFFGEGRTADVWCGDVDNAKHLLGGTNHFAVYHATNSAFRDQTHAPRGKHGRCGYHSAGTRHNVIDAVEVSFAGTVWVPFLFAPSENLTQVALSAGVNWGVFPSVSSAAAAGMLAAPPSADLDPGVVQARTLLHALRIKSTGIVSLERPSFRPTDWEVAAAVPMVGGVPLAALASCLGFVASRPNALCSEQCSTDTTAAAQRHVSVERYTGTSGESEVYFLALSSSSALPQPGDGDGEGQERRARPRSWSVEWVFKDRSSYWLLQEKSFRGEGASLLTLLQYVVREAYMDEFASLLGLPRSYVPSAPGYLCLPPYAYSSTSGMSGARAMPRLWWGEWGGQGRRRECLHKQVGVLQQRVRITGHSRSGYMPDAPCARARDGACAGGVHAAETGAGGGGDIEAIGDVWSLLKSGAFAGDDAGEHQEQRGLLDMISEGSFEDMALLWFVTAHPDFHGGNIMLTTSMRGGTRVLEMVLIDADFVFNHSPGCTLGRLQLPCAFGGVATQFSRPCIFSAGPGPEDPDQDHPLIDDCPRFPQADRPFSKRALRLLHAWGRGSDAGSPSSPSGSRPSQPRVAETETTESARFDPDDNALLRGFFRNQTIVDDACRRLDITETSMWPSIRDVLPESIVQLAMIRVQALQQVLREELAWAVAADDETPPRRRLSIREVYHAFVTTAMVQTLRAGRQVFSHYDPSEFVFKQAKGPVGVRNARRTPGPLLVNF